MKDCIVLAVESEPAKLCGRNISRASMRVGTLDRRGEENGASAIHSSMGNGEDISLTKLVRFCFVPLHQLTQKVHPVGFLAARFLACFYFGKGHAIDGRILG